MIYVISKATFGSYNVRDIQFNANWDICPYSDYAVIPDNLVEDILATQGYCDITLNAAGSEVVSFTARTIPDVPEECHGVNTVLSVNGMNANDAGEIALQFNRTVNLPAANWSSSAPYTQTIQIDGILGTDRPHYGVVYAADQDLRLAQKEAFAMIDDLDTADGSVTFTCFEDKPGVDLTIQMEVNR